MKINIHNYPAYFLDYYEGQLSDQERAELFSFLEKHPELKEEFSSYYSVSLQAPEISFPGRSSLKKATVTPQNWKTRLVAFAEGDLSENEKKEVELFLNANPHLTNEKDWFAKAKLKADLSEVFPGREYLKKGRVRKIRQFYYAAAAVAAILILVYTQVPSLFSPADSFSDGQSSPVPASSVENTKERIVAAAPASVETTNNLSDGLSVSNNQNNETVVSRETHSDIEPLPFIMPVILHAAESKSTYSFLNETWQDSLPDIALAVKAFNEATYTDVQESSFYFDTEEKKRFAWHDVLNIASKVIRRVSGREVEITREYDSTGEVTAYALNAGVFEISRPVK